MEKPIKNTFKSLKYVFLIFLFVSTFMAGSFRAKMQYASDFGYRDTTSRKGWGALCSHVHREVVKKKVLVVGETMFFPLFGDTLSNELHRLDPNPSLDEILRDCLAQKIDYVAVFPSRAERKDATAFIFDQSVTGELIRRFPEYFKIVKDFGSSQLVQVRP